MPNAKLYTVTILCSVDVEAESPNAAANKACAEASFGTDLYDFSIVDVEEDDE